MLPRGFGTARLDWGYDGLQHSLEPIRLLFQNIINILIFCKVVEKKGTYLDLHQAYAIASHQASLYSDYALIVNRASRERGSPSVAGLLGLQT